MADITRVPPEEIARRELHMQAQTRPFKLHDPYTWAYRYKAAAIGFGSMMFGIYYYGRVMRHAWHFGLAYKVIGTTVATATAYALGTMREDMARHRDAVVEHYMEIYPEDFKQVNDMYGRQYGSVMLPWVPRRAQYNSTHKKNDHDYD